MSPHFRDVSGGLRTAEAKLSVHKRAESVVGIALQGIGRVTGFVLAALVLGASLQAQHSVVIKARWIDQELGTPYERHISLALWRDAVDEVSPADTNDTGVILLPPAGPGFMFWSRPTASPSSIVAQCTDARQLGSVARTLSYSLSFYFGIDTDRVDLSWDTSLITGDPILISATLWSEDGTVLVPNMGTESGYVYGPGTPGYDEDGPEDLVVTFAVQSAVTLAADLLLEGVFDAGLNNMRTDLQALNLLPHAHPFDMESWNYSGQEFLEELPENSVDWVLVRLFTGDIHSPPLALKYTSAGVLGAQGRIRFPAMGEALTIAGGVPDNYYVAVYSRNHLPVISASPIDFTSGHGVFDVTQAWSVYTGESALAEVDTGRWGLVGGDASGDGNVFPDDLVVHLIPTFGQHGYLQADFDLDGDVFPSDLINLWIVNSGRGSSVPDFE